ncbi:unnamed protein product [Paramecium pentaurelia]|uniref:Uncharacterized protein n=1 Tax=Paramecium pentaurelia TaxID=43138 RepID=A0A8S1VU23_9CILI|nr:unnamed protein product [Paramecium pentaurelia]
MKVLDILENDDIYQSTFSNTIKDTNSQNPPSPLSKLPIYKSNGSNPISTIQNSRRESNSNTPESWNHTNIQNCDQQSQIHQQINSHNEQPIVINQQQQISEQFSLKEIIKLPNENAQIVEQPKNLEITSLIHQKSQNIMPQSIKIHNHQKEIQLIIFLDQNELNTINKSQDSKQRKQQPSVDHIEQKRFYTLNQNQQKSQQQQEDTLKDRNFKELSGHSGESVYNQVVKINTLQQKMKKEKENTQINWIGSLRNKQNILEKTTKNNINEIFIYYWICLFDSWQFNRMKKNIRIVIPTSNGLAQKQKQKGDQALSFSALIQIIQQTCEELFQNTENSEFIKSFQQQIFCQSNIIKILKYCQEKKSLNMLGQKIIVNCKINLTAEKLQKTLEIIESKTIIGLFKQQSEEIQLYLTHVDLLLKTKNFQQDQYINKIQDDNIATFEIMNFFENTKTTHQIAFEYFKNESIQFLGNLIKTWEQSFENQNGIFKDNIEFFQTIEKLSDETNKIDDSLNSTSKFKKYSKKSKKDSLILRAFGLIKQSYIHFIYMYIHKLKSFIKQSQIFSNDLQSEWLNLYFEDHFVTYRGILLQWRNTFPYFSVFRFLQKLMFYKIIHGICYGGSSQQQQT